MANAVMLDAVMLSVVMLNAVVVVVVRGGVGDFVSKEGF
jgi:hypothetical protein